MLYHADAYDADLPVGSYWEDTAPAMTGEVSKLAGATDVDVAIIGGGYTGLNAALHLAKEDSASVAVLDAGHPGWAASGRNGGFCILGGTKLTYPAMVHRHGLDATRAYFRAQCDAVDLVSETAKTEGIQIDATGAGEIVLAHKPSRVQKLADLNDFLNRNLGAGCSFHKKDALAELGVGGPEFFAGMRYPMGFALHPMKYVRGLADACLKAGAKIYGHSPVVAWRHERHAHVLVTPEGEVRAKTVIVATNGYTPEGLLPGLSGRTLPVPSNIVITRPLSEAERRAQGFTTTTPSFDSRTLLHYFRLLPDGRFLLGMRGTLNTSRTTAPAMRAHVTGHLRRMFPAWADVEITHFWRGFVCMAWDKLPHIGVLDGGRSASGLGPVIYGLAYHGNGVSMGTYVGRALAAIAAAGGDVRAANVPALMTRPPRTFPLPALRLLYLRAAMAGYRIQDRFF